MQIREIKRMPVVNLVTNSGFESALGDEWRIHPFDNHDDGSPKGDPGPMGHRSSKADQGKWSYLFDGLNPNDDPYDPQKVLRVVTLTPWLKAKILPGDLAAMRARVRIDGKATLHVKIDYGAKPGLEKILKVDNVGKAPTWTLWDFKPGPDPSEAVYGIQFYVRSDETPFSPASEPHVRIDAVLVSPK